MYCCPTEAHRTPVASGAGKRTPVSVQQVRRAWRSRMGVVLALGLMLGGCGGGGTTDEAAPSAYLVARYAGIDGLNGNPWPPVRDRLSNAGVALRSARCVHRLGQAGEVQGDTWAGDPPVWVVIEISSRQLDKARAADAAWTDYDAKATTIWAPYQGNAASCPATAG